MRYLLFYKQVKNENLRTAEQEMKQFGQHMRLIPNIIIICMIEMFLWNKIKW